MTLKECLAALRAERLVALPAGEAVEAGEGQNRPAKTAATSGAGDISPVNIGDSEPEGHIYPTKPEDSWGQSEIYPRSTRISPSTPVKQVQGDIFFGEAPEADKIESYPAEVAPLGEIRVDCGVSRVEHVESRGEIGENGPNMEVRATAPTAPRRRDPHLTPGGTLVIPFDSEPKYHWWKGGQSVEKTRAEVLAKLEAERRQTPAAPSVNSEPVGGRPGGQELAGPIGVRTATPPEVRPMVGQE